MSLFLLKCTPDLYKKFISPSFPPPRKLIPTVVPIISNTGARWAIVSVCNVLEPFSNWHPLRIRPLGIETTEPARGDSGTEPLTATAKHGLSALTLGSIGVVFGDIGTSPLYAMREALAHSSGATEPAILGVVSLVFWALTLIVTVKYVFLVLRADNKGEGGTLALMALAQHVIGRRTRLIFVLGVCGAALFYGDSLITPAISVLSAAEGILAAPGIGTRLSALCAADRRGHSHRTLHGSSAGNSECRMVFRADHGGVVPGPGGARIEPHCSASRRCSAV